jgi:MATE family multidrug resistance protein
VPLAVHGIYMSTANIMYMVPQAIALATATLTGNALGADKPREAVQVVNVGIVLDFFYGLFAGSILLFVLRPYWGSLFTVDQAVKDLVYSTMPVMFLYLFVDATKCVTLTILRSTGRPTVTVFGNAFACLMIMLPLGWELSQRQGQGLTGLWVAMSVAWLVMTLVYLTIVMRTDWQTQIIVKKEHESEKTPDLASTGSTATVSGARQTARPRADKYHTITTNNSRNSHNGRNGHNDDVEMAIRV